jgi:L1 cell adhesion molecule like protein
MAAVPVGIDLGAVCSCVGVWRDDEADIVTNERGNHTTPSYVAFTATGVLVGEEARDQAAANPRNTVFDAKRLIGRVFDDAEVQLERRWGSATGVWPFAVVEGKDGEPAFEVEHEGERKAVSPEAVSAMVLGKMRGTAADYLELVGRYQNTAAGRVGGAVLAVPAHFNDAQREATRGAGQSAGLDVVGLIDEPAAAAIAYGLDKNPGTRTVLVFDLGAALDVTLLKKTADGAFQVTATARDPHLGDEIDREVVQNFARETRSEIARVRAGWEVAKRILAWAPLPIAWIDLGDSTPTISRAHIEDNNAGHFRQCIGLVEGVLQAGGVAKADVDDVVLVGGSALIPMVLEQLSEYFDGTNDTKERKVKDPKDAMAPERVVAYGATLHAARLTAPLPLGIATASAGSTETSAANPATPATPATPAEAAFARAHGAHAAPLDAPAGTSETTSAAAARLASRLAARTLAAIHRAAE